MKSTRAMPGSGLGAEWKYNKKSFISKSVVAGLVIGLVVAQKTERVIRIVQISSK